MIAVLSWLGIVRVRDDGSIRWPLHVVPLKCWRGYWGAFWRQKPVGLFRNRPGVISTLPGRVLPRRWGFFVLGVEIGDRG